MHFREMESGQPGPESGRFGQAIAAARRQGQPPSGIWHLFAANPEAARPLCDWAHAVLRGPSPLSPGFRELVAAFTSRRNRCLF
ncbi:MAG: peroxidase [Planctomycetia bacterium]